MMEPKALKDQNLQSLLQIANLAQNFQISNTKKKCHLYDYDQ